MNPISLAFRYKILPPMPLAQTIGLNNRFTAGGYTYDAAGNVLADGSGITTLYWGAGTLVESDTSGNVTSEYIFLGGRRIARRDVTTGSVYYYFADAQAPASPGERSLSPFCLQVALCQQQPTHLHSQVCSFLTRAATRSPSSTARATGCTPTRGRAGIFQPPTRRRRAQIPACISQNMSFSRWLTNE